MIGETTAAMAVDSMTGDVIIGISTETTVVMAVLEEVGVQKADVVVEITGMTAVMIIVGTIDEMSEEMTDEMTEEMTEETNEETTEEMIEETTEEMTEEIAEEMKVLEEIDTETAVVADLLTIANVVIRIMGTVMEAVLKEDGLIPGHVLAQDKGPTLLWVKAETGL